MSHCIQLYCAACKQYAFWTLLTHNHLCSRTSHSADRAQAKKKKTNSMCFLQYDEAKTELSDLKEKYEKTEQEKQSLTEELEDCKANMKELQEKGTKVSASLPQNQHFFSLNKIINGCLLNTKLRGAFNVEIWTCSWVQTRRQPYLQRKQTLWKLKLCFKF